MAGLAEATVRLGVFGGTFDPPHLAHLVLAADALDQLRLDRLLWVLTPNPPHKQGQKISPQAQRLEMLEAAISGHPGFEISRVDLERKGPHYAVDTVRILRAENPGAELVYLVGGDSLHNLPRWRRPDALVAEVDELGAMRRPGDGVDLDALEMTLPGLKAKVRWIDSPLLDISGTDIRARIRAGRPFCYFLPSEVTRLIRELGIYQR